MGGAKPEAAAAADERGVRGVASDAEGPAAAPPPAAFLPPLLLLLLLLGAAAAEISAQVPARASRASTEKEQAILSRMSTAV